MDPITARVPAEAVAAVSAAVVPAATAAPPAIPVPIANLSATSFISVSFLVFFVLL
jgi:hypothetical protein